MTSLPNFRRNRHLRFLYLLYSVILDVEIFAHSLLAIAPLAAGLSRWEYKSAEFGIPPLGFKVSVFIFQEGTLAFGS